MHQTSSVFSSVSAGPKTGTLTSSVTGAEVKGQENNSILKCCSFSDAVVLPCYLNRTNKVSVQ